MISLSNFLVVFSILLLLIIGVGAYFLIKQRRRETYVVQSEKRVGYGSLLAGLSHELKNPLNFIYAHLEPLRELSQYLKEHPLPADQKLPRILGDLDKMTDNMEEGVARAQELIEKVRYFPNPRPDKKEMVDLNPLIDRSIELLSHKWKDKIEIEKSFEEIPPVRGYPGELSQVFTNILSNAIDATPPSGTVKVSSYKVAGGIKVSIRDHGPGIPKSDIGRIFDPFFTTKKQGEGTGLGLAITQQIIKSHKGRIEVKSQPGEGTEFLIFLPS